MKKLILTGLFIILFSFLVMAQEEHDFGKAKQLVDSGISCSNLTNEQLESIGDYFMEQMHPGEAHEYMDRMMGGEGSESLKQVHINIARRIYCNEKGYGMMNGGMMGMMGNYYYQNSQNGNSYQNNFIGFQTFFYILIILVIIILVLVTLLLINKLKKGGKK